MYLALMNALISDFIPGCPRRNVSYLAVVLGMEETGLVLVADPICAAIPETFLVQSPVHAMKLPCVFVQDTRLNCVCFSMCQAHSLDLSEWIFADFSISTTRAYRQKICKRQTSVVVTHGLLRACAL